MTCSTTMAAARTAAPTTAPTTGAAVGRGVHPVHVHVHVRLRDGGSALLRPLVGGEVAVLETVFEGLSTRSRRQRFLVPMPRLPSGHRRALADVDGHRHVAWVALVDGFSAVASAEQTNDERASPASGEDISPTLANFIDKLSSAPIDESGITTRVTVDEQAGPLSSLERQTELSDSSNAVESSAADVQALPEPSSLLLLSLGLAAIARLRSRRAAHGR